jgi:hypothetical protein
VCAKVTLVIVLTLEVLILLCAAWLPVVNGIVFGGNYVAISMPVLLKAEAASATTLNSEGSIDTPKAGQTVGGTVNVAGWYLDGSGVASIDILVDGILKGQASYGDARPDVKNAYPEYGSTNCGYHYALDTTALSGVHTITVLETGNNGLTNSVQVAVTVQGAESIALPPRGNIEAPKAGQTVGGTVNVVGWYLDGSGVASIDILVDGILKGQASYGDARPDVKNAYPEYGSTNCGYHYALNVTHLPNGPHVIQVREIGMNDGQSTQQVNINLLNSWLSYDVSRSWALEISPSFILVSLCAFFFVIIAYLVDLISSISFFKR